jgi:CBS domain-containing protein
VLEYSDVVGFVTVRDVVRAAATGRDPDLTVVKDIMSPKANLRTEGD